MPRPSGTTLMPRAISDSVRSFVTSVPAKRTRPPVLRSCPVIAFSVVVLPAPSRAPPAGRSARAPAARGVGPAEERLDDARLGSDVERFAFGNERARLE